MASTEETRQFIRHPTDIPIRWRIEQIAVPGKEHLKDISTGGLAFVSQCEVQVGSVIEVNIPIEHPEISVKGEVVWCKGTDEGSFEVGVRFVDATERFRMRMVEQVCHIEHYKKELAEQGGPAMTSEEAALDWIRRFAKDFPR